MLCESFRGGNGNNQAGTQVGVNSCNQTFVLDNKDLFFCTYKDLWVTDLSHLYSLSLPPSDLTS